MIWSTCRSKIEDIWLWEGGTGNGSYRRPDIYINIRLLSAQYTFSQKTKIIDFWLAFLAVSTAGATRTQPYLHEGREYLITSINQLCDIRSIVGSIPALVCVCVCIYVWMNLQKVKNMHIAIQQGLMSNNTWILLTFVTKTALAHYTRCTDI